MNIYVLVLFPSIVHKNNMRCKDRYTRYDTQFLRRGTILHFFYKRSHYKKYYVPKDLLYYSIHHVVMEMGINLIHSHFTVNFSVSNEF